MSETKSYACEECTYDEGSAYLIELCDKCKQSTEDEPSPGKRVTVSNCWGCPFLGGSFDDRAIGGGIEVMCNLTGLSGRAESRLPEWCPLLSGSVHVSLIEQAEKDRNVVREFQKQYQEISDSKGEDAG